MLTSPRLQPADRVRVVSPAAPAEPAQLRHVVDTLTGWGLIPELADQVSARWRIFAGTDQQRASDLDHAFRDPGVRAVFVIGGAGGIHRIVGDLDVDAVRRDPKPVVGVDGTTPLHLALWRECRLAGLYASLAAGVSGEELRRALMCAEQVTLRRDPGQLSAAVSRPGTATGVLIGGSLAAVRSTIGVARPDFDGSILLIADRRTIGLGQVDRQLTHLRRAHALDGIAGVVLGRFPGFDGYTDRGWGLVDVLRDHMSRLDVPVLGGIPLGGDPSGHAAPIGTTATIDVGAGTLTADPAVH